MRKKFLSYVMMVIVTFVVGVNVVKAEDYTFSTKVYKVDVVDDNFITRYNNGEFQEVQSGGTLNAGDTIAVGVYVDVKNAISSGFDIRLNWDDGVLEQVYNEDTMESHIYDSRSVRKGGFYPSSWNVIISSDMRPYTVAKIYDTSDKGYTLNQNVVMYWLFYKVKDNVEYNAILTFSFRRITAIFDYGRKECVVTSTPSTFKINAKKKESYSLGDVNGNGKIDFGDVMLSMAFYTIEFPMEPNEKDAADMNGDGRITLSDTLLILDKLKDNN